MQFQGLILIALSVLITAAPPPPQAPVPGQLIPLWKVHEGDRKGGCDNHFYDLQTSYFEVVNAVDKAKAAIDVLKRPRPSQQGDPNGYRRWNRYEQTLRTLFGIRMIANGAPNEANLNAVREQYDAMTYYAKYEHGTTQRYWLFCNDDFFEKKGPNDRDPRYPGWPPVSQTMPGRAGFWYDTIFGTATIDPTDQGLNIPHLYCNGQNWAAAWVRQNAIVWCPSGLNARLKSLDAIKPQIQERESLNNYKTMTQTWLHELAHLTGRKLSDQQAVDWNGNPLRQKVYGFNACAALAKHDPSKAINTPDTYALFAVAMYLNDWNWAAKYARRPADS